MHPLLIPVGLAVAIAGLFWPTEDKEDGEISKDGGKRGGGNRAGKPVSGSPTSNSRSRIVKPADPEPILEVTPDVKEPNPDNDPAPDVRGDLAGDDSGSKSHPPSGPGEAEPLTGDDPPPDIEDKPDA